MGKRFAIVFFFFSDIFLHFFGWLVLQMLQWSFEVVMDLRASRGVRFVPSLSWTMRSGYLKNGPINACYSKLQSLVPNWLCLIFGILKMEVVKGLKF